MDFKCFCTKTDLIPFPIRFLCIKNIPIYYAALLDIFKVYFYIQQKDIKSLCQDYEEESKSNMFICSHASRPSETLRKRLWYSKAQRWHRWFYSISKTGFLEEITFILNKWRMTGKEQRECWLELAYSIPKRQNSLSWDSYVTHWGFMPLASLMEVICKIAAYYTHVSTHDANKCSILSAWVPSTTWHIYIHIYICYGDFLVESDKTCCSDKTSIFWQFFDRWN